jgi:hypothetical protein
MEQNLLKVQLHYLHLSKAADTSTCNGRAKDHTGDTNQTKMQARFTNGH